MALNRDILTIASVCFIGFLIQRTSALSCLQCGSYECPQIASCPYGRAKDVCNCCCICAKGPGQSCGGMFNLQGTCGKGFTCVSNNSSTEDPFEGGVCMATE